MSILEDWRRITSSIEGEGSPQELAEQFAEAIEAAYSDLDIKALVASKGLRVESA